MRVLLERRGHGVAGDRPGPGQPVEHGDRHVLGVRLEVAAQRLARVAAAEAVGPQWDEVVLGTNRATWSDTAFT